ncbi:hypothetical protein Gekk315_00064 [Aeromonas phage Gekk3-15]
MQHKEGQEPIRIFCGSQNCNNTKLIFNRLYKPISHDATEAGWVFKDGRWRCDVCVKRQLDK